ncbi:hypothetical protein BCR37DRAFT_377344 [Protomyces lactucae-debilis]|uniref:Uncharacterized protein n=1 Tax=Protomyces lactucae-debilis TaxID=2754530 RepID=A0A1Y2FNU8_PROLT|nr:uncharacterized protein BCR37DRAFT_377344 [Protomyces lactucae-debilis]ORY85648.1 hypothetical protein BCR37DRAFT_377344 [Protomyces lactucae-debilis]
MSDLGKHAQAFTGRGGAGNYVIKNPIPEENLPKQFSQKPVHGNFSGRGGAGNFATKAEIQKAQELAEHTHPAEPITKPAPIVYKGGRGGAGNIEAVQYNDKHREDLEIEELIRTHKELQAPAKEEPILKVD